MAISTLSYYSARRQVRTSQAALITSAFGIVLMFSMTVNWINLGMFPAYILLIEWVFESIEFPLAMMAGAQVYEGLSDPVAI